MFNLSRIRWILGGAVYTLGLLIIGNLIPRLNYAQDVLIALLWGACILTLCLLLKVLTRDLQRRLGFKKGRRA